VREILFRGKRTSNGEWEYGDLWRHPYGKPDICIANPINGDGTMGGRTVLPETVGQFTGLTDKNGERIYEGDILESRASENKLDWKRWKVYFEDGCFAFESYAKVVKSRRRYRHEINMLCADEIELYGLVVVGNIHDNPELMMEVEV